MVGQAGILTLAALAAGALSITPALACKCEKLSRTQATARADVAFEGRVVRVRVEGSQVYTEIETSRPLKGAVPRRVELGSRRSAAACGVMFREGQRLTFAARFAEQQFTTNSCLMNAVNSRP